MMVTMMKMWNLQHQRRVNEEENVKSERNWGIGGGYVLVEFFGGRRKALGLTHSTDEAKKAPVPVWKQLGNTSSGFSWVRVRCSP